MLKRKITVLLSILSLLLVIKMDAPTLDSQTAALGYGLTKLLDGDDLALAINVSTWGTAGGMGASYYGAQLGGKIGAIVGGPIGVLAGIALGAA